MTQSGLTPYQDECLLILMEECAETTQEICKIQRFGLNNLSHHSTDKSHLECLQQEVGDLLAMIEMVVDSDIGLTWLGVGAAKAKKLEKVKKWMTHKPPVPVEPGTTAWVMHKALELAKREQSNFTRINTVAADEVERQMDRKMLAHAKRKNSK
jgi:hypothetical protein